MFSILFSGLYLQQMLFGISYILVYIFNTIHLQAS